MPMYRAKVKCFVDNGLREVDDVFEYNGPFNGCLEPLDPTAQEQVEEAVAEEPKPKKRWTPKAKRAEEVAAGADEGSV